MVQLTASCHCKSFTYPINIPSDIELPISETTCSCNACRYRTGQICISTLSAKITQSIPTPEELSGLSSYDQQCGFTIDSSTQSSEDTNGLDKYSSNTSCGGTIITSYFCGKCGTKLYLQVKNSITKEVEIGMWMLGSLDKIQIPIGEGMKPIIYVKGHHFLNDTLDGGISNIWKYSNGKELNRYHDNNEPWEPSPITSQAKTKTSSNNEDMLHLHCKCENFSVYVRRPNPTLPLPENCYWYQHPFNDEGVPQRYMASWCACTSCRTTTGSSIPAHPWVIIPFIDIFTTPSSSSSSSSTPYISGEMTSSTSLPGLTLYHSTPSNTDVSRYFCSKCGASILYFDAKRSFIGTFALGLNDGIEKGNGTMNTSWFSWWTGDDSIPMPVINHKEDGEERWGKEIMDEFEKGLIEWGKSFGQRK